MKILLRILILALIFVLIACVGGIAALDIPIILLFAILVIVLGIVSYLVHNKKGE